MRTKQMASASDLLPRVSLRSDVSEKLQAAIVLGQLQPGVVYSAPMLAEQFKVSPTPVREAMMGFANEGFIEIVRNRGYRVVEPSQQEIDDIFELRQMLEGPAVFRIAKEGIRPSEYRELRKRGRAALDFARKRDFTQNILADIEFHCYLVSLAGNAQLAELVRTLRIRSRILGLDHPANFDWLIAQSKEHLEMADLINAGDAKAARKAVLSHSKTSRRLWWSAV